MTTVTVAIIHVPVAKPIDLLAKYINTSDDNIDIEMQEPYHLLRVSGRVLWAGLTTPTQGLNIVDLEDLLEDMKVYIELEGEVHSDFWKVCDTKKIGRF